MASPGVANAPMNSVSVLLWTFAQTPMDEWDLKSGGLSTTPDDPAALPPHVRPASRGGKGKLPLFVIEVSQLDHELVARRDPKNPLRHAFIEPAEAMSLSRLQQRLCATRAAWKEAQA